MVGTVSAPRGARCHDDVSLRATYIWSLTRHATGVLWSWRPLDGWRCVRLHTFDKALEASDGAYLSSGSLQPSRFMITADACLKPTREGRFSESRHVSRETMVSTLCPPASTPFIRQHEYNSSRGHSPAPRIKGPTSRHDILAPFVFPLTAKDPVLRHKDSTCTFWKFVCRTVPFPSNHLSTISVVPL